MISFDEFTDKYPKYKFAACFRKFYPWFNKIEVNKIYNFRTITIAKEIGISQPTFLRYLRFMRDEVGLNISIQFFKGQNGYTKLMIL